MNKNITENLIKNVKALIDRNCSRKAVIDSIIANKGVSARTSRRYLSDIRKHLSLSKEAPQKTTPPSPYSTSVLERKGVSIDSDIITHSNYTYNVKTDTYVITVKSKAKPLVMSGQKIRAMTRSYSDFGQGATIQEICTRFKVSTEVFNDLKSVFKWSHSMLPLTNDEVENESVEDSAAKMMEDKKMEVFQKFEKESWKSIQIQATKWENFEAKVYDPILNVLESWEPKVVPTLRTPQLDKNAKYTFVCGLNDTHISEFAKKEDLYHGGDYNSLLIEEKLDKYCSEIFARINEGGRKFKDAYIIVNGDYLHSCVDGKTFKGTSLTSDLVNEEMFELGLRILTRFVERFAEFFPKVHVKVISGNHDSIILNYLGFAAKQYFRNEKTIAFEVSKTWANLFKINKVAVIAMHGGSDRYKAFIPNGAAKIKAYIQELLLARNEELVGCTQKIAITGHKHAYLQQDMGSFEFYCFGASVLGGHFEDAMNYRSKARQNCLVLNDTHVIESQHYYF